MLNRMVSWIKGVFTGFLLLTCMNATAHAARPFIIDTDAGVDDVIAIMYLLQRPDIHIKAITIASTGNAHCLPALRNMMGLLKLMNRTRIPVDCGRLSPLGGKHHFPQSVLDESDTLAGAASLLPKVDAISDLKAVDLMISTIKASRQPVTILAIGPLTNIAEALQKAPEIKNRIQAIYIMGGAVRVPGNLSDSGSVNQNVTAEWNIYLDPQAASMVFNQNIPIILVPLDASNKLPIAMDFYNMLKKRHHSEAAKFVYALLKRNMKFLQSNQWYFWDPLAAVIAADESIASFDMLPLKVALAPEIRSGTTMVDKSTGQNIRVAGEVDSARFKYLLVSTLNKMPSTLLYSENRGG
ncbi:Pyrimidine-specific ribonucleoside hydrolase RihA [Aquicella siphonis]|uniref:Pyrimidine-specific ribonucleoside hydrolase RihA n=1 Tax=Aquicella siphonis TaxID=254247 RepID=A0A5E4PKX1_9COXI|nr:nucleoside hydrolase [Aquicella siphonis]VVC77057.1 Pyrimidine-specific ribonucleoside hydrolase RihA [Aquicella siphonis]